MDCKGRYLVTVATGLLALCGCDNVPQQLSRLVGIPLHLECTGQVYVFVAGVVSDTLSVAAIGCPRQEFDTLAGNEFLPFVSFPEDVDTLVVLRNGKLKFFREERSYEVSSDTIQVHQFGKYIHALTEFDLIVRGDTLMMPMFFFTDHLDSTGSFMSPVKYRKSALLDNLSENRSSTYFFDLLLKFYAS